LVATMKWRQDHKVDEIRANIQKGLKIEDYPGYAAIIRCYPHIVNCGLDKTGNPVGINRAGSSQPELMVMVPMPDFETYFIHTLEQNSIHCQELTKTSGKVIRTVKIFDLAGLSIRHVNRAFLKYFRAGNLIAEAHYPETLGHTFVVNAPWAFKMVWAIIKPWLAPHTLAKVEVLAGEPNNILLASIDGKYLPTDLGGTAAEGIVPSVDADEGFKVVDVGRHAIHEVQVDIKDEVYVSWEFRTEGYDIGFGLKHTGVDGKTTIIREVGRVDCHLTKVSDGIEVKDPGVLTVIWDNTFSKLRGKRLIYRVDQANQKATDAEVKMTD